jgi:hypothetical protein
LVEAGSRRVEVGLDEGGGGHGTDGTASVVAVCADRVGGAGIVCAGGLRRVRNVSTNRVRQRNEMEEWEGEEEEGRRRKSATGKAAYLDGDLEVVLVEELGNAEETCEGTSERVRIALFRIAKEEMANLQRSSA